VTGLFLKGSSHSNITMFWYFTVNGEGRSAESAKEEYIIDSYINGYKTLIGADGSRNALGEGDKGSPYLGWFRMARLETPLNIIDKINDAARSAANYPRPDDYMLIGAVKFTGVPMR
jgi:hypothetical protein